MDNHPQPPKNKGVAEDCCILSLLYTLQGLLVSIVSGTVSSLHNCFTNFFQPEAWSRHSRLALAIEISDVDYSMRMHIDLPKKKMEKSRFA